jgi:hypothetical protein
MKTTIIIILTILISTCFGQTWGDIKNAKPIIFYKTISRGDTADWFYGLVHNKDTFNVIKSGGEKSGLWLEYYNSIKTIGKYQYGQKNGTWTGTCKYYGTKEIYNETCSFDNGVLLEKKEYFDNNLQRHTKLNSTRDTATEILYYKTGLIEEKRTLYLTNYPCTDRFTGLWEHLGDYIKTEYYDEKGTLIKVKTEKK